MKTERTLISTGLPGLDRVLQGLLPGDNVVWEVDALEDYLPVLNPLMDEARRMRRPLVYFHFSRHARLLPDNCGADVHELDPQEGFDSFLTRILEVAERAGRGSFYIFDCLSDLAADWFSDRMLGNFFRITCPYLYDLETIAYFALQKNLHSLHATQSIFNTAQVIIEVYRKENRIFIHPKKVWERHTSTMYAPHSWDGDEFRPVTRSATITDILASLPKPWLEFTIHRPGVWTRTFQLAEQTVDELSRGLAPAHDPQVLFEKLMAMAATREARFQELVRRYFTLDDLVGVLRRMIGTGLIGGKSLGMLLARAILRRSAPHLSQLLEAHDSFYVGSDVFYTYLVRNGCWHLRRRDNDFNTQLRRAEEVRHLIESGTFPEDIQTQFVEMLDYFGQSPLIVRSSSLLEDNYGNAFSGKYESVFCVNQGTPQQRLTALLQAVRTVYTSSLSEASLRYRSHHGLLDHDEQMALLIQRVSGELHQSFFFPDIAGVAFSFNPFVWHQDIDPKAGFLRLVFGLGTRAVDRTDDDYTRLVALNAPLKQPGSKVEYTREFAQRRVDVLDFKENALLSRSFEAVAEQCPRELLDWFAEEEGLASDEGFRGFLNLDRVISETAFIGYMRELCRTLQRAYHHPVDLEFTANFTSDGKFRVDLLQCRPFQVRVGPKGSRMRIPATIDSAHVFLRSRGPIVGHGVATIIDRLIYVAPAAYSKLGMSQRYSVARTIGRVTHLDPSGSRPSIMLVGPGRWGTSMPALGVPVSFAEINTVSAICELAVMHEGLSPDVSLGTHFFNDLVEMDMLYFAVSPERAGHLLNEEFVREQPNLLESLIPSAAELAPVIWVIDSARLRNGGTLFLNVNSMTQSAVCYWSCESGS
jgi:pyruvate, water dikinase